MFSRSSGLVFLAISFCVRALPQSHQEQCDAASTVIQTVTAMAQAATNTATITDSGSRVVNKGGANDTIASSPISSAIPSLNANAGDKNDHNATEPHTGDGNQNNRGSNPSSTIIASTATSTSVTSAGKKSGNNNNNPQTSSTLNPKVIASGFANNGQDVPTAGQVASLTSTNNFINFCLTVSNFPITNGKQITTGSCNPAPMGLIPSSDNMPSSKFTFPKNFATLKADQTFTIEMAIKNMQTGFFVNADANYFAAPQQLNDQGQIQGHSHVVIEELSSLEQTTPTNPKNFVFFKGLNDPAANGKLSATVPNGLKAGFYKLSSINTAMNHQPLLVPIAQHGSLDDAVYFSVTSDGAPSGNGKKNGAHTASADKSVHTGSTAAASDNNIASVSPASDTVLPSVATSPTLVSGAHANEGLPSTSSFIPAPTSPTSTKGKRELRNRFNLNY